MLLTCAFIFANLCIPQEYTAITKTWSMIVMPGHGYEPAAVRRSGAEIDSWESDSFQTANPHFMNRVCSEGWCIYYRRHCDSYFRNCSYSLSVPLKADAAPINIIVGTGFEIHARSKSLLKNVVGKLFIVMHEDGGVPIAYLPLNVLDRESNSVDAIGCSRVVWFEGCERPVHPQSRRPRHL